MLEETSKVVMGKKRREEYVSTFTGFFKNQGAGHFFKGLNLECVMVPIFFLEFSNISLCLNKSPPKHGWLKIKSCPITTRDFLLVAAWNFNTAANAAPFSFNGIYTPEN